MIVRTVVSLLRLYQDSVNDKTVRRFFNGTRRCSLSVRFVLNQSRSVVKANALFTCRREKAGAGRLTNCILFC